MIYTEDALAIIRSRAEAQRRDQHTKEQARVERISAAVERLKMMLKLELGPFLHDGLPITYEFRSTQDCIEANLITPDTAMCIGIRYIESIDQGNSWLIDEGDEIYQVEEWKLKEHLLNQLAGWVEVPEEETTE